MKPAEFIARWRTSQGREESKRGPFLHDLCIAFGLNTPGPWTGEQSDSGYVLEFPVNVVDADGRASTKNIVPYKQSRFILDARQTVEEGQKENADLSES